MKKNLKTVAKLLGGIVLLLVLVIGGYFLLRPKPPQPPESITNLAEAEAEAEVYLEELVEFGTPPGISIVVVKNGDIVYSKGFGLADGPNNIPAKPETVYRFWSVTKIMTAISILQLHEQNLLDIENPVADYLPFFDVVYPSEDSETITIRHLLNHSSGLSNNMPEVMGWMHTEDDNEPRPNEVAFLEDVFPDYAELIYEPGDTKCDLFIRHDISSEDFIHQMKSNDTLTNISEAVIVLNSGQPGTRIELESMGRTISIVTEINERVVLLTCFGDFGLVDEIAVTLKASE
jgi:hypothetical protein